MKRDVKSGTPFLEYANKQVKILTTMIQPKTNMKTGHFVGAVKMTTVS